MSTSRQTTCLCAGIAAYALALPCPQPHMEIRDLGHSKRQKLGTISVVYDVAVGAAISFKPQSTSSILATT